MPVRRRPLTLVGIAALCGGLATVSLVASPTAAAPSQQAQAAATYSNPVVQGYTIDFPDPAVIRGKDGVWYGYATGGPHDEQGTRGSSYKIGKSTDLVHWTEAGDVFNDTNQPPFAAPGTGFWAPDVRYLNGQYLLYFTVPNTTASGQGFDPAIGVATAPHPAGPWTPKSVPVIPAKPVGGGYDTTIDPALFTDTDGTHYLYWGGYGTGLYVVQLTADGLSTVGEPKHIASSRFEGPNVLHRDGWYYLFGSSANCCAGPTTGYTVFVGRSKSPFGPFTDRLGKTMLESRTGGTPVIAPNGNKWIGTGHHSAATDVSGEMYMAYHAIDRNDPWLDVSPGFTMRPMNLDRLDWIDGWPIVRAGLGASESGEKAPVAFGEIDDRFDDAAATQGKFVEVLGDLANAGPDAQSGGFGKLSGNYALAVTKKNVSDSDVRVEADVRTGATGSVGVVARVGEPLGGVRAVIDAKRKQLRIETFVGGHVDARSAPIPAGFDYGAWHVVALQARGRTITADVTDARLADPWAEVSLKVPGRLDRKGRAGVTATGGGEVDNFSANALYEPVRKVVPAPKPGKVDKAFSDEFNGGALGAGWSWVRDPDPEATVSDGKFKWPTQIADLVGDGTPSLLVRDQPTGDFTIETKLTIDLGVDTIRNYQQGGILVYVNDDDFLRFDIVAVEKTRIAEFGKETIFQGRRSWGGGVVGPPGDTTWLRLVHTLDPKTGEHRYRAASSLDGKTWVWGLTWTLPADATPKIGLTSQASLQGTTDQFGKALSQFDYFRVSRP